MAQAMKAGLWRVAAGTMTVALSASIGALLGVFSDALSGGGHGSALPAMFYLGLCAILLDTVSCPAFIGASTYAVYGASLYIGLRLRPNQKFRTPALIVLLAHYLSVGTVLALYWGQLSRGVAHRLARSWRYAAFELLCSALLFAVANAMVLLLPFRSSPNVRRD